MNRFTDRTVLILFCLISSAFAVRIHTNSKPAALSCDQCKSMVSTLVTISGSPTLQNLTVDILDVACNTSYANNTVDAAICRDLSALIVDNGLPWIVKELNSLAWDIPLTVCSDVAKVCQQPCCLTNNVPEQVHLSLTSSPDFSEMRVAWTTLLPTASSIVQWWTANSGGQVSTSSPGANRTYVEGGWVGMLHSALMTKLHPATTYTYRVGDLDTNTWSAKNFTFTTLPTMPLSRPLRVVAIADMAYDNTSDATVAALTQLVAQNQVDLVLHYGDVSYADGDEQHWDIFWRKVEPIASAVPYMTTPGNHEFWWNFTSYKHRVWMPTPSMDVTYYALAVGPVFFLMMDSESWIDTANIPAWEVAWADSVMATVNRTERPFLFAVHHRPLYCTSEPSSQCKEMAEVLRSQVEAMYNKNRVDVVLSGHMHNYERTWPIAGNGTVAQKSYQNPTAPTYIVNGAAGNREGNDKPHCNAPWDASPSACLEQKGFMTIEVSMTQAAMKFWDSEKGVMLDSVTITK